MATPFLCPAQILMGVRRNLIFKNGPPSRALDSRHLHADLVSEGECGAEDIFPNLVSFQPSSFPLYVTALI